MRTSILLLIIAAVLLILLIFNLLGGFGNMLGTILVIAFVICSLGSGILRYLETRS